MLCESLSWDLAYSLNSIKNGKKIAKKRKNKKKFMKLSPDELNYSLQSVSECVANDHDYKDSDFCKDEAFAVKFNFVTTKEILKRQSGDRSYVMKPIDKLLDVKSGDVIEVCGRHQMGKTLLITTLSVDLLRNYPDVVIAFIDTKKTQQTALNDILNLRGYDEITVKSILSRIIKFNALNLFDLIDALKTIAISHRNVSFIMIDSITEPFFRSAGNGRLTMKMTSEIHQLLFELAKKQRKTILITNLVMNSYKLSVSDDSQDGNSSWSSDQEEESEAENEPSEVIVKPAIEEYWSEILDSRILISMSDEIEDVFGFFEVERKLTVLECNKGSSPTHVKVNITDQI